MKKCPGQDSQYWTAEDIFEVACGNCGYMVEFFKTDGLRRCRQCGLRVTNPRVSIGCAQWCESAKECLGYDPQKQEQAGAEKSLLDELIAAMKKEFGSDQPRITHALRVLEYAEEILHKETADPRVVLAAAVLHDIGIQQAEKEYGSSAGQYQEITGVPIARRIMNELGIDAETLEHACKIIANHHSARDIDTAEFRIVWDADWLVNIATEYPLDDYPRLRQLITKVFRTAAGKKIAREIYLTEVIE